MEQDNRVPCKYGVNCYQKNEAHHKKYKHEEKRKSEEFASSSESKKPKLESVAVASISSVELTIVDAAKEANVASNGAASSKCLSGSDEPFIPESPENVQESIKQKFLIEMPDDFYSFWDLCKSLRKDKPSEALASCGLYLVGPFDVLSGALRGGCYTQSQLLRHWRYFYDPPEFQTVIRGDDKTQFHMGYFRDDPNEPPVFVASNCAAENCVIKPLGPNLFAALNNHLTTLLKSSNPFEKMKFVKIQSALQTWAKNHNIRLIDAAAITARKKKTVCQSFHKAGIVVPYDKKTTVGYRELEDDATLRKILDNLAGGELSNHSQDKEQEKLTSIINFANIANDECDFGAALELGINLFCSGHEQFHAPALCLLRSTYPLLQRQTFTKILEAHLKDRKKGIDLSIIGQQD